MRASKEFVEKYYIDDLAEQNSEESRWSRQWSHEVRGKHVLNIGCGPQLYNAALEFAETPKELIGIDLNQTNIEFLKTSTRPELLKAKKVIEDHKTSVDFFVWNIKKENNKFINRFDTVFASGVLGMFSEADVMKILCLISKYLKKNGRFVMVSWGDDRLNPKKFRERNKYGWYWRKGPDIAEIGKLIQQSGLEIVRDGVYKVKNPEEYEWGVIYGFVAKK